MGKLESWKVGKVTSRYVPAVNVHVHGCQHVKTRWQDKIQAHKQPSGLAIARFTVPALLITYNAMACQPSLGLPSQIFDPPSARKVGADTEPPSPPTRDPL